MSNGLLPVVRGRHLVIDDISGFKISSAQVRVQWDGIVTSGEDFSPKNPQLNLRGRDEDMSVTPTRVRPPDRFVTDVDPNSLNGKT